MPKDSPGRIATLDGLRALSIGLVLVGHALGTGPLPALAHGYVLGETGVRTFFVISGFLITTLLLRERARTGHISLGDFYLRRAFRIFPAFYTYLAVVGILVAVGAIAVSTRDFVFAATYTMNFHEHRAWWVGHLWSLAVEEQFYLLWPVTMVALGTRRAAWVAAAAILVAPILRVATWYDWPAIGGLTDQAFPFVFDALATGCLLAILRDRLEAWRPYHRLLHSPWFWYVPVLGVLSTLVSRPWFERGLATTAANLGIALAVHRCVSQPARLFARMLELPGVVWVGTISYSLYLWQQPLVNRHAHGWEFGFPANIALVFPIAMASYYLIERPVLGGGRRFMARRAASRVIP